MSNRSAPNPPTPADALRWSLWRMDDNGNRFLVHPNLSREEAARLAAEYESRGHKQTYWAEPPPQPTADHSDDHK